MPVWYKHLSFGHSEVEPGSQWGRVGEQGEGEQGRGGAEGERAVGRQEGWWLLIHQLGLRYSKCMHCLA